MEENYCVVLKALRKILLKREQEIPDITNKFYDKMKESSEEIKKIFGPKTEKILTGKGNN